MLADDSLETPRIFGEIFVESPFFCASGICLRSFGFKTASIRRLDSQRSISFNETPSAAMKAIKDFTVGYKHVSSVLIVLQLAASLSQFLR